MDGNWSFSRFTLSSELELPELPLAETLPITDKSSVISIYLKSPQFPVQVPISEWHDGSSNMSITAYDSHLLVSCEDVADFYVDADNMEIFVSPSPKGADYSVRHLLLDQVLPRLISHYGGIVLHACLVDFQGETICVAGSSGIGKSTISSGFAQLGGVILSDDAVHLSTNGFQVLAQGTYQTIRLHNGPNLQGMLDQFEVSARDPVVGKLRLTPKVRPSSPPHPSPLRAIFLPQPEDQNDQIGIEHVAKHEACVQLISNAFLSNPLDANSAAIQMKNVASLIEPISIYRLTYPRNLDRLPELCQKLHEAVIYPKKQT